MKREQTIYLSLLALRLLFAFAPGYIHPDEFFQNPEITAGDVFHIKTTRPWEYSSDTPSRSIIVPYLTTGLPFLLLRGVFDLLHSAGLLAFTSPPALLTFLAERLAFFCLSLTLDFSVYSIVKHLALPAYAVLSTFASSYIVLVYQTHAFSNSVEHAIYAGILALSVEIFIKSRKITPSKVKTSKKTSTSKRKDGISKIHGSAPAKVVVKAHLWLHCALGSLLALGVFTRITFVAFVLPVVLCYVVKVIYEPARSYQQGWLAGPLTLALSGLSVSLLTVLLDTFYFGTLKETNQPVLTPLNNLLYNFDTNNLREHGMHPRVQHLLVNLPIMYGMLGVVAVSQACWFLVKSRKNLYAKVLSDDIAQVIEFILSSGIILSLCMLSAFPHQEPRFLVPLATPLVLLAWLGFTRQDGVVSEVVEADHVKTRSEARVEEAKTKRYLSIFWTSWLVLNLLGSAFFGIAHQGGIVPAMSYLQQEIRSVPHDAAHDVQIVFWKTYMPPVHLLGLEPEVKGVKGSTRGQAELVDLAGAEIAKVQAALQLHAQQTLVERAKWWGTRERRTFLVVPSSSMDSTDEFVSFGRLKLRKVRSIFPHVNTDDVGNIWQKGLSGLFLNVYVVED